MHGWPARLPVRGGKKKRSPIRRDGGGGRREEGGKAAGRSTMARAPRGPARSSDLYFIIYFA